MSEAVMTEQVLNRQVLPGGIVRLTLNRPQAFNALSEDLLTTLQVELDAIAANPATRVVILGGCGAPPSVQAMTSKRCEPSPAPTTTSSSLPSARA